MSTTANATSAASEGGTIEASAANEAPTADLDAWLNAYIDVLRRAHDHLVSCDFRGEALADFLTVVQDLQGQAVDLGYPLAGAVAVSLRHLIDGTPDADRLPRVLVRQHVEAIRAIVAEGATGEDHAVGKALSDTLRNVTDVFVETEAAKSVAA